LCGLSEEQDGDVAPQRSSSAPPRAVRCLARYQPWFCWRTSEGCWQVSHFDSFSKYAHFIPLNHPYTAESVVRVFFAEIVRLHGIPVSIVSDRDPVFTSTFWRGLFRASGSTLLMSSAFHPQTDGQTEAVNKAISIYLRCLTGDRPR
jgi:transposase InsO family protein